MRFWPIAVIGLTCLISSGCRTDPAIQLLERDNRRLEDEIYRLRACLEDGDSDMVTTSTEAATTKPLRHRNRTEEAEPSRSNGVPPDAALTPPSVEMHESPENEVPGINKHPGDAPTRSTNPNKAPGAFAPPRNSRAMPGVESAGPVLGGISEDETSPGISADNTTYVPPPKGDSMNAVQIVLHDRLCTASETDGIRVVFEARDRHDRRVDAPADVSIVLIDPALVPPGTKITPPEARVARWDFPADAVSSMFRGMKAGKAIYIQTPWPDKSPEHKNLMLFVRYTTRDGRKLIAGNLPIEIKRTEDRTTRSNQPRRLQPTEDEPSGPALAQESPASRSLEDVPPADTHSTLPENRREPLHTASRENGAKLQRPVWSPERR